MTGALLDEEDWTLLRDVGRDRAWPAGRTICREGDPSSWVLAVADGRIKLTIVTLEGQELLLGVLGPDELLGHHGVLDGRPRSATATALERVEGVVVGGDEFVNLLDHHGSLAVRLARSLAGRVRESSQAWAEREGVEVSVRVARRLLDLADRFGEIHGRTLVVGLNITQADLAAWVGASREATNRALAELREVECLQTGRRRIVITDRQRLAAAATGP